MTTSCCPAFINMQRKHFPKVFEENVSSIVSPMCAISPLPEDNSSRMYHGLPGTLHRQEVRGGG